MNKRNQNEPKNSLFFLFVIQMEATIKTEDIDISLFQLKPNNT